MTLLLLAGFVLGQIPGGIDIDPALGWYTLETEHFSVHFSCRGTPGDDSLALANEVAATCEEVYATLTPAVGWAPSGRTQVVIADFYDYSNGWAAPFPDNTITIIPTPPGGSRTNFDNWLRDLVLHEYSHILQMDQAAGWMRALRSVFGRVALPNALAPVWLDEGYAVYNETRFSNFGRLRSAEYDMAARAAADSSRLLFPDQCGNYELERYPGGDAPYLYGSWLCGHVAARGDSVAWDRYNRDRAAGLPFFENVHARRALGKSIYDLWDGMEVQLIDRAERRRRSITQRPLTPLRRLTQEGWHSSSPSWSRSGSEVYYVSNTGREYPSIRAADTSGKSRRVVYRGPVTGNLSLSPDGRLLAFARLDVTDNCYELSDIYAFDLVWGGLRRLTRGERARDPDFAPDTSLLVFVSNGRGQNNLRLLDLTTGVVTSLTETEDRTSYHSPRFSPSGKWIVVGVSRTGGYSDIELVDRGTGWTIPVTHDRANDISPCWSRTGKYVFFASDRTGVYNLYAYQLSTGETFICTNALYGVFEPAVSPDNRRIALVSHSVGGDDISLADFRAADWAPAPEFEDSLPLLEPAAVTVRPQLYYYNPFPTIVPKFWLPLVLRDSGWTAGAFTTGWDALQFHRYRLVAGYRENANTPFLNLTYELHRYRPVFSLALDADRRSQGGIAGVELPFRSTQEANWFDLSARVLDSAGVTSRLDLDWAYSNAHVYRFDVAPTEGRALGLHLDGQHRRVFSDRTRARVLGYCVEYVGRPPATWSLRARLAFGTAFGDTTAARAFTIQDEPGMLGVRGYGEPGPGQRTVAAAGFEFRAPLWWMERGLGTGPLFLRDLNGALFTDFGAGSVSLVPETRDWRRARVGVGGELRLDVVLAHLLPAGATAGVGFGLNPLWSWRVYLGLESSLLGALLQRPGREDAPLLEHVPAQ